MLPVRGARSFWLDWRGSSRSLRSAAIGCQQRVRPNSPEVLQHTVVWIYEIRVYLARIAVPCACVTHFPVHTDARR